MPRETKDIRLFNRGIVSGHDKEDIPDDAASYSLDIDNNDPEGFLRGRFGDVAQNHTGNVHQYGWIERDGGQRDLIYHNMDDGKVGVTQDFYGAHAAFSLGNGVRGSRVTMVPHNREVFVGRGKTLDALWAGYIDHPMLNSPQPGNVVLVGAGAAIPKTLPFLHKVYATGNEYVGFEFDSNKLYRIARADGAITVNDTTFHRIRAIAEDPSDATHFWVFDQDATYGTIRRVSYADINSVDYVNTLGQYTWDDNEYVSDMVVTTNKIWFAKYRGVGAQTTYLLNVAKPSGSASNITVTDATPQNVDGNGAWYYRDPDFVLNGTNEYNCEDYRPYATYFKRSLARLNATTIGWLIAPAPATNESGQYAFYYKDQTGAYQLQPRLILYVVAEGDGAANQPIVKLSDTLASVANGLTATTTKVYLSGSTRKVYSQTFTVPTTTGEVITAGAVTTSSSTASYDIAVCQDYGGEITLTRLAANSGLDSIADTLVGPIANLVSGGFLSVVFSASGHTSSLKASTSYFYKFALGYDGYQSSPLTEQVFKPTPNDSGTTTGFNLAITINQISAINLRCTSLDVYRSEAPGTTATQPNQFYRLIQSVPLTRAMFTITGNAATITIVDENATGGVSFEANTGLSEVVTVPMPRYAVSAILNNELFVGNCSVDGMTDDLSHVLFKSKTGRPSMFDVSSDYCRLPFVPTSLVAFNGRLLAFKTGGFAVVNPATMTVEDMYDGAGCFGDEARVVTDRGLFFCDASNVYRYDGKTVASIGDAIRFKTLTTGAGWTNLTSTYRPMVFSALLSSLILFYRDDLANRVRGFVYNIDKQRWDMWDFVASNGSTTVGGFSGYAGDFYFTTNAVQATKIGTSPTRHSWTWISKDFAMDAPSQQKKFYRLHIVGTGSLNYAKNGTETWSSTSPGSLDLPAVDRAVKSMRVMVTGLTGDSIQSLSVIYRKMVGER